jgi:hypothetical protein
MIKRLLLVIVLTTLLMVGCSVPKTQTQGPTIESPRTCEISTPADVIFSYGRLFQYWTYDDHLTGDQTIEGLSSWQLSLVSQKVQQEQQEHRVVVHSPYPIPNESRFQPEKVEREGSLYSYTLPFKINEFAKPEIIIIPPLSTAWSQFSTGLNIDAQVTLSDIQEDIEIVTIKVSPQCSFNGILVALETDKDVTLLADAASPPTDTARPQMIQWNIPSPQLNKEYTFSVQLQLKGITDKAELYKPRVIIKAITAPTQQKKQPGQSLSIGAPELGSLTFEAAKADVVELDRSDQVVIYLWQSSTSSKVILVPPINGWGFCKSLDTKQNPVGNSLLFSSEDSQVTFWVDIDVNAFENAGSVEFDWIGPSGEILRTNQVNLSHAANKRISDTISLKEVGANTLGTWHVRLLLHGEPLITPFFLVLAAEESRSFSIPVEQAQSPHFVAGDEQFRFVGAFVTDGSFNQISADKLIATAKMSGLSVLTLMLPYAPNYGDESSLRQLDVFLDRASAHGIYVIVTFLQGVGMSLLDKADPFYSPDGVGSLIRDQSLKTAYKDLLTRVIIRENTVNGKLYRDDPTIMAWDLITEPINKFQKPSMTIEDFNSWLQEMTSYIRTLDPNHLVTMCLSGPIDDQSKDWPDAIMRELDFFFVDTCLYDMLYKYNQPLTADYMENFYWYPLFSFGKPVVPQLAFTSNMLVEEFATDYGLQGQIYQDALQKGFQRGIAGMTIFSWGATYNEGLYQFDHYLTYDAMYEDIIVPLLETSASLGTLDWPKPPLQFVRVAP